MYLCVKIDLLSTHLQSSKLALIVLISVRLKKIVDNYVV